jgi:CheY-like chemotaxis protein
MTIQVLVVDASEQFGTLIQQALENTGHYQVTLVSSGIEAIEHGQKGDFRLAIVDFDLPDVSGPDVIRQLQAAIDDLAVIAIPMSTGIEDPDCNDLEVAGLLSKPFYLPDLSKIVIQALDLPPDAQASLAPSRPGPIKDGPARPIGPLPPWLADADQANEYLNHLFVRIHAVAAILTRDKRIWAYAGKINKDQVEALTRLIIGYCGTKGTRGVTARFIKLPGSVDDVVLYTTTIAEDIILTLVSKTETHFNTARRQAESLSNSLSKIDPTEYDFQG